MCVCVRAHKNVSRKHKNIHTHTHTIYIYIYIYIYICLLPHTLKCNRSSQECTPWRSRKRMCRKIYVKIPSIILKLRWLWRNISDCNKNQPSFTLSLKHLAGIATLKSSDTTKLYVCWWLYVCSPLCVEPSSRDICRLPHKLKFNCSSLELSSPSSW